MDTPEPSTTFSAVKAHPPAVSSVRSVALTVLALIAVGTVAWLGRPILAPLTFGVVLSLLLSPVVRTMGKARISPPFAAGLTLVSCIGLIVYAAWTLSVPASKWLEALPRSLEQVTERFEDMRVSLDSVTDAAEQVDNITGNENSARKSVLVDNRTGTAG